MPTRPLRPSQRARRAARRGEVPRPGPRSRDRHWLYQEAVQSPDVHFGFFDRVFRAHNGRLPYSLKEDFCGTALLATEWVQHRSRNTALGVDLDRGTLRWGLRHNVAALTDEQRARVELRRGNVLHVTRPRVDITVALNFSYFIFRTPDTLREYFRAARRSLRPGGLFICDMFGGWDVQKPKVERTRLRGFTYLWQLEEFDPVSNFARFHIHFKFHDRGGIRRAFTYEWRLWSVPEVRDLLLQAGFESVDLYWEGIDRRTGYGNSVFRKVARATSEPGWIVFFVAWKDPKRA